MKIVRTEGESEDVTGERRESLLKEQVEQASLKPLLWRSLILNLHLQHLDQLYQQ